MHNKLALSLRRMLGFLLLIAMGISPASLAWAQTGNYCTSGQSPNFEHGFADLKAQLGSIMGTPTTCEYPDPNGTGDVEQNTSTGQAFLRKSTNNPTFTDGSTHWALTSDGLATWTGNSFDPPTRNDDWQTYVNARYAFAVEVPPTWVIGRESYNGDGAPLYSGDPDVMITASGSLYPEVFPGRPDPLAPEPGFRSQPLVLNDGRQATLSVGRRGTRVEEDVVLVTSVTYLGHPDTHVRFEVHADGPDSFFETNQSTLLEVMSSLDPLT